jgi:hypothetical protein
MVSMREDAYGYEVRHFEACHPDAFRDKIEHTGIYEAVL